jgi:lipoprotein-anchoring transpeptidase ErfK/SrfK
MRNRKLLFVALFLVFLLAAGAVGAYAYDHSRRDTIAKGVTIGSVEVGGLKPAAARAKLEAELLRPLSKPVVVAYHGRRFPLSARTARIAVNLDGMVEEALRRSRDASIFSRISRDVTGGTVDTRLRPKVVYSHAAVERLAQHVASALDRAPQDASVSFAATSLGEVAGHDGVKVDTRRLRRVVAHALVTVGSRRTVTPKVQTVKPKVSSASLASRYGTVITVDRSSFRLYLWKDLKLSKTYAIAVGQVGLDTPAGLYAIQNKAVDPVWSVPNSAWAGNLAGTQVPPGPSNPIKARWMGIYAGAGIHGTDDVGSIGSAASHGCIRMAVPDVVDLYDRVPVGAPVYIA